MTRLARRAHRIVNLLILAAIPVQFYAAGWATLGGSFAPHAALGWSLLGTAVLATLLALVGFRLHRITLFSLLLTISFFLQPVLVFVLSRISIAIAALHPVNALVALYLAVELERRITAERIRELSVG